MSSEGRYIPDEVPGDFWSLIDGCGGSRESLRPLLEALSEADLHRFCWNYEEAVGQIATLYQELTSFSEDTIQDICSWIVSKGEDAYVDVWDNAEDLIVDGSTPYGSIQADPGLWGAATTIYRERYGKDVDAKRHDRFV